MFIAGLIVELGVLVFVFLKTIHHFPRDGFMHSQQQFPSVTRREFVRALACTGAAMCLGFRGGVASVEEGPHTRIIPRSGEAIPAIGMGTWITFNVGDEPVLRAQRVEIMRVFLEQGGRIIDSSPMYGTSEAVVGYCLAQLQDAPSPFSATKVWTRAGSDGIEQMAQSRELWGLETFDLMQVHNLIGWRAHLKTLDQQKDLGRVRYIGVTTSHGRRHRELETIMRNEPIDFVQLTYNILDREAEDRLLPLAAERGIAVIANRPFRQKELFLRFAHHPLPEWAGEIGCDNWAQFFLKFIISHPAVTCAIPATSQVAHMQENMGALYGPLPDQSIRERMRRHVEALS